MPPGTNGISVGSRRLIAGPARIRMVLFGVKAGLRLVLLGLASFSRGFRPGCHAALARSIRRCRGPVFLGHLLAPSSVFQA